MADFQAQVGSSAHPGLADHATRLSRLTPGQNPYSTGHALPPDSPMFFGRARQLAETLALLRRPDKPGSVSVLGERRFGKSSFLNRVRQAFAAEPGLVTIHATTQEWTHFFSNLRALGERPDDGFGYLIASRRPLKERCIDHRIKASSFCNTFGFPHYTTEGPDSADEAP